MNIIKAIIEAYKLYKDGVSLRELERLRFLEEVGRQAIMEKIKSEDKPYNGFNDIKIGEISIHWRDAYALTQSDEEGS